MLQLKPCTMCDWRLKFQDFSVESQLLVILYSFIKFTPEHSASFRRTFVRIKQSVLLYFRGFILCVSGMIVALSRLDVDRIA